jgi:hypothetical protein
MLYSRLQARKQASRCASRVRERSATRARERGAAVTRAARLLAVWAALVGSACDAPTLYVGELLTGENGDAGRAIDARTPGPTFDASRDSRDDYECIDEVLCRKRGKCGQELCLDECFGRWNCAFCDEDNLRTLKLCDGVEDHGDPNWPPLPPRSDGGVGPGDPRSS